MRLLLARRGTPQCRSRILWTQWRDQVLNATWQRCRVHFMRNVLAHVGTKQRQMVAAAIRTAFTQEWRKSAHGMVHRSTAMQQSPVRTLFPAAA